MTTGTDEEDQEVLKDHLTKKERRNKTVNHDQDSQNITNNQDK